MSLLRPRLRLLKGGERRDLQPAVPVDPEFTDEEAARAAYLTRLFDAHRKPLHQYLTRLLGSSEDAEELVQETYIRLLGVRHLEQLDNHVQQFLFKIATNLARDRFRQRKARSFGAHVPYDSVDLVGEEAQPDEIADWDLGMRVIKQALLDLTPRHREVFLLHVSEHLSYRSIAKRLGVSTKTVERDMMLVLELCQSRLRVLNKNDGSKRE